MEINERTLQFGYTNFRGEFSLRTVTPREINPVWRGETDWHPDTQYFISGYDHDKNENRDFALGDCDFSIGAF